MYDIQEIKTARNYWSIWLSSFTVGQSKVIDPEDKKRIAVCVSSVFHARKLAKFKIKTKTVRQGGRTFKGETTVTRIS